MIVYLTTNLVNGKLYVGQTNGNRNNYLGSGLLIMKAIKKYGKDNLSKQVLVRCNSQEELDEQEIFWIQALHTLQPEGYNIENGGNGVGKISEGTKRKLSEVNSGKSLKHKFDCPCGVCQAIRGEYKNRTISEETKMKISEAQKGRPPTFGMLGKKHSKKSKRKMQKPKTEEAKRKIGKASEERWKDKEYKKRVSQKMSLVKKEYWKNKRSCG